jgi:chorismate synthase
MKAKDLIEALQKAEEAFKIVTGKPLEIFDLNFDDADEYNDYALVIKGSSRVTYDANRFGGSKSGMSPSADIYIRFECENKRIVDRSISLENVRGVK